MLNWEPIKLFLSGQAIQELAERVVENLDAVMTDKYGSHVARRLLCVLCGWNVSLSGPSTGAATDGSKFLQASAQPQVSSSTITLLLDLMRKVKSCWITQDCRDRPALGKARDPGTLQGSTAEMMLSMVVNALSQ